MPTKKCSKCDRQRSVKEFGRRSSAKDGLRSHCKSCEKEYAQQPQVAKRGRIRHRKWSQSPKGQHNRQEYRKIHARNIRNNTLLRKYGITLDQYEQMTVTQNDCCAICGGSRIRLCVDHNHKTGAVRGLLCIQCNVLVGQIEKQWERLEAAQRYLQDHMND